MTWIAVAELVGKYGIPFVEKLLANAQNNTPVTLDEWNSLKKLIETPFDVLVPPRTTP